MKLIIFYISLTFSLFSCSSINKKILDTNEIIGLSVNDLERINDLELDIKEEVFIFNIKNTSSKDILGEYICISLLSLNKIRNNNIRVHLIIKNKKVISVYTSENILGEPGGWTYISGENIFQD